MDKSKRLLRGLLAAGMMYAAAPLFAQDATAGASIDPATIHVPDLHFEPDAAAIRGYDIHFYFHRDDTDFATAYADIQECDGYVRGVSFRFGPPPVPYPYAGTAGGVVGSLIGAAILDATAGSAERRRIARMNMRTCMGYKAYRRYGLPRDIWLQFNFEEGAWTPDDARRQRFLMMQAKVASGERPQVGEIGR